MRVAGLIVCGVLTSTIAIPALAGDLPLSAMKADQIAAARLAIDGRLSRVVAEAKRLAEVKSLLEILVKAAAGDTKALASLGGAKLDGTPVVHPCIALQHMLGNLEELASQANEQVGLAERQLGGMTGDPTPESKQAMLNVARATLKLAEIHAQMEAGLASLDGLKAAAAAGVDMSGINAKQALIDGFDRGTTDLQTLRNAVTSELQAFESQRQEALEFARVEHGRVGFSSDPAIEAAVKRIETLAVGADARQPLTAAETLLMSSMADLARYRDALRVLTRDRRYEEAAVDACMEHTSAAAIAAARGRVAINLETLSANGGALVRALIGVGEITDSAKRRNQQILDKAADLLEKLAAAPDTQKNRDARTKVLENQARAEERDKDISAQTATLGAAKAKTQEVQTTSSAGVELFGVGMGGAKGGSGK